ncbi:dimethyl sulfoxide reductase anchor subunit [Alphaproteobacteria bacterium]|nr:dimethyl sulfoxide reductase anchor subunit [Alphaproteobacteria bacterium]
MHPAFSVIIFTTSSGAGYGLLALLGFLGMFGLLPTSQTFGAVALGLAFVLITGGLLTSTLHLGHPERAWRAFSQWRSSWLSREGVLAVATYVPMVIFAIGWVILGEPAPFWSWFGLAAAVLAVATVAATAMIYASLVTIPNWATKWTLPVYLALAVMTGALWLAVVLCAFGYSSDLVGNVAIIAVIVAGLLKRLYWQSIDTAVVVSTAESATGLGHLGAVRVLEQPTTSATYVMREMGYRIARKHSDRLRRITLGVGFLVPLILLAAASAVENPLISGLLIFLAALAGSLGVITERWLFFAEAKHVSMLYH